MSAPERLIGQAPEVSEWTLAYWGTCGTPEVEASQGCVPCLLGEVHPFHHGPGMEPNSQDLHLWERGGWFAPPRHV
jgi:hypothetical protein